MRKWNFFTTDELKPTLWLKRQLEIQAEGLSGSLDKMWPDIKESAWIGGEREGWERVPYWLDGFIPLAYLLRNEDMICRAKKYIDAIIDQQCDDGWICPCSDDQRANYDSWAVILIAKVLTVYYDCSKDERIPTVIYRVLKNYYELLSTGQISLQKWAKFRWFECFIAIDFTYQRFKEDWLLKLSRLIKVQGADYNSFTELWKRPINCWRFETHIVNLTMMLKSEAVSCDILGEEYTDNAEYLREILGRYNSTVYESFTGDECLSGLSPIQGTELCSIVEQMYSYELLYAYTGDSKWAERLEVLAFNALPATISDDMWTHQYLQMSNQISCQKFPGKSLFRTNDSEAHLFGLEPNFGCCTANFNQGWPKLALSTFMYRDNTVINALMLPCELKTDLFNIKLETNYPFENEMKYTIDTEKDFNLIIRIPSFAKNLTINGKRAKTEDKAFEVKAGHTDIYITFDTVPQYKPRPYGLNAVQCGSILFSVPIKYDKIMKEYEKDGVERKYPYCDYEFIPDSDWNYAYCSDTLKLLRNGVGNIPFSSENPPLTVKTSVKKINWGLEDGYDTVCAKIPESTTAISDAIDIDLYPYGCSKLRMTELPKIE